MHRATVDSLAMRIRNLTAAGLFAALLLPAGADAATKPVFRGPPPNGELKGVKGPAFDSSFYPNRITLRAGDKIKLTTLGFGDTLFVPKGQRAPAFAVPNPDAVVSGAKDAAGGWRRTCRRSRRLRWPCGVRPKCRCGGRRRNR